MWQSMSDADNIISLYERNAARWDAGRGRDLFERPWLDRFTALLPQSAAILDLGCGAGEPIADYLLTGQFRVTGVDSSSSMIDICRGKFPAAHWCVADMRHLDLGRRFEGLIAWHSFFHLTPADQVAMFPIFAAHLGAGAALMFTSGPAHGEALGEWCGEPLYHGSLDRNEYRQYLAENGFAVIDHVTGDPDCGHATIWLAVKQ